jgi:hypothetical protein
MAYEYARRFGCEEGFRDAKRTLGFAAARIAQIEAWARMFALVAAALLVLAQWGTHPGEWPGFLDSIGKRLS